MTEKTSASEPPQKPGRSREQKQPGQDLRDPQKEADDGK